LRDVSGPDESRYVTIAGELLGRGNWLALELYGQPYDQKPPLAFWMFAACRALTPGVLHAWAVRVPAILAGILTLLALHRCATRWRSRAVACWAAFILLLAPTFFDNVPRAELNILYAFWTTLSILAYLDWNPERPMGWRRWGVVWGALAAAFLTKGPLAILVVLAVMGAAAVVDRSWRPLRNARLLAGMSLVLAAAGIWFAGQAAAFGADFVLQQIHGETVNRFAQGSHGEPPWYYLLRLPRIAGPLALLAIPAIVRALRPSSAMDRVDRIIALGWVLIPFIILSLASGKRNTYLLPILPGIALLTAGPVDAWARRAATWRAGRPLVLGALALSIAALVGLALLGFVHPGLAGDLELGLKPWMSAGPALAAVVLATAAVILWPGMPRVGLIPAVVLLVQGAVAFSSGACIAPAQNAAMTARPFAEGIDRLIAREDLPPVVGAVDRVFRKTQYHVYGRYHVTSLSTESVGRGGTEELPAIVVVRQNDEGFSDLSRLEESHSLLGMEVAAGDRLAVYVRIDSD